MQRTTSEEYVIRIIDGNVAIEAEGYFGLRHGIETLSQLMAFDDVKQKFVIIKDVVIQDSPVFTHRGVLLDSARNFMSIETIKNVIKGMAYTKVKKYFINPILSN